VSDFEQVKMKAMAKVVKGWYQACGACSKP
jgi:hypothetical protein